MASLLHSLLRESIRIILLIQLALPYPRYVLANDAVSERVQGAFPGSLPGALNERSYAETIEFFRYLNILSAEAFRFLQDQIQMEGWDGEWETNETLQAYQKMTELLFNSWLSVIKLPVLDSNPLEESLRELPPPEVDPFLNRIQLETHYQVDLKTWKIPSLSDILSQFQNSKIRLPSKMALTRGMKMTFLYEYLQRTLEFYQIHGATHPKNASAPEWNVKLPQKYRLYFDEVFGSSILTVKPTINDTQDFELSLSKLTRLHLLQTGEGFHPDAGKYLRLVKFLLIYQFLIRGVQLSRYKSAPSVFQYELPEGEFSTLDGAAEEIFQNMEAAEKEFVFRTKLSDMIREDALEDLPIFFDRELIADILEYLPAFNDPEQADLLYQKYALADGEEPELEEHTLLKNQVAGTASDDSENNGEETEEPRKDVSILLTSFAKVSLSEMDLENLSSFFMRLFLFLQRRAAYERCLTLMEHSPEQNLSAEARKIHYLLQLREAHLSQDPIVIESYKKITQRWVDKMARQNQDDFKPRNFLLKKLKEESKYLIDLDAKIKQAESGVDVAAEALPEDTEAYFQTRQMIEMLPDSTTPPSSAASESHLRTLFKDWTKGREAALERLKTIEQKLREPSAEGVERTLLLEERDDLSNFIGSLPAVTSKSPLSSSSLEFKGAYLTQLRKSQLLQNRILLAPIISPIKSEEKELYKVFHEIEKSDRPHNDKETLLEKSLDQALALQENNIRKNISDLLKAQDLEDLRPFVQTGIATLALMNLNPEWQGIQEQIDEQLQPGFLENMLNIYLPRIFWCEMALLLVLVAGTFLFPAIAPVTAVPIKALGAAIFVEIVIMDIHTLYRILPGWFPVGGSQAKEIARLDQIIHSTVLSGGDDKLISPEAREMLDNQLWWERVLAMTLALPIQFFYYRSIVRRIAYFASQSPQWPGRLSHARKTLDVSPNATLEEIDAAVRRKLAETPAPIDAARAAEIKFAAELLKNARSREVLEITNIFTPDELEQAFRQKSFELHPDRNPNLDGNAFGEVRIAYDYLVQFAPYSKACRLFGLKTDSFLTPPVLERIYEQTLKNLGDSQLQRILGVMSKKERLSLFERSLSEPVFRQNKLNPGNYETLRSGIQKGDGRALRIWLRHGDRLTIKETVQRVLEENYGFLLKESEKNYVAYILSKYGPQVYGYFGFQRKVQETIEAMKKGAAEGPKAFEEILLTDIIERIESGDLRTRGIIQIYFQDAAFVCDQLRKAREFVRRGVLQETRSPVDIFGPALLPEEATHPPKGSE